MFIIPNSVRLLLIIVFITAEADYITINWNVSTIRGYSHIERYYKYPMYEEVAPVPCDLTDSCDIFCPQDTDCDELQKQSFPPAKPSSESKSSLSVFDCSYNEFEKPEWLSVFCFVYKNPIYLGKFFETQKKIAKFGALRSLIGKKRRNFFSNKQDDRKNEAKVTNKYGSPIMTFVPMSESFPSVHPLLTKMPLNDFSFACTLKPVRYGFVSSTVCLTKITQDLCENGYMLSILPYLVQGNHTSTYSDVPIVLKDLEILKGIKTEVSVKWVDLKSKIRKLKKQKVTYFQQKNVKPYDTIGTYQTVFENNTCQNVLVYVQHDFTLNGSDVVELKVEYGLTDVTITTDGFRDIISKYIYLKQRFAVSFFDEMTRHNNKGNFTRDDELLNRGYFVGEELNFGYKHTENSTTSWEKGKLSIFKNGDSCDTFSPITFGFDYFSVCHIGKNFSNCSQFRMTAEEKFNALWKGDSLASYSNLRAPYNNSVPLLRSYPNSSHQSLDVTATCSVPVVQDVHIQYTTVFTESGKAVHRVLGIRIDRSFENVTDLTDVVLTSRAFFSYVPSVKGKPRSRFWERMHSSESSENSWLRILNAFDDVTRDESEEITFWCILLVLFSSAVVAFFKLDVNLGNKYQTENLDKFLEWPTPSILLVIEPAETLCSLRRHGGSIKRLTATGRPIKNISHFLKTSAPSALNKFFFLPEITTK